MPVTAKKPTNKGAVAGPRKAPPKPAAKPKGEGAKATGPKVYAVREAVWAVKPENASQYSPNKGKYWPGGPVTHEDCMRLLGWEEIDKEMSVDEAAAAGCNLDLKKLTGRNIILKNNARNRFLTPSWLLTLRQEHLNGRWYLNGDSIVIGEHGQVLSGQNRMIGLVLAYYEWENGKRKEHWREIHKTPPVMETLIAFGVPESDDVFRTLNAVLPNTVAQVVYRSDYLKGRKAADRRYIGKIAEHAVTLLWHRTGVVDDKQVGKLTNSEAMDFIRRHPRLMEVIDFVWGSIGKGEIAGRLRVGYATGLVYLMATSASDPNDYVQADAPNMRSEAKLSFDNMEKAKDFWRKLFKEKGTGPMAEVRKAMITMSSDATPDNKGYWATSRLNRVYAVLCRAWEGYLAGEKLTADYLKLKHHTDKDGITKLVGTFTFGGVDEGVSFERKTAREAAAGGKDKSTPDKPAPVAAGAKPKGDKAKPKPAKAKPSANGAAVAGEKEVGTQDTKEDGKGEDGKPKGSKYALEVVAKLKAQHGSYVMFFKRGSDNYQLWGEDAYTVGRLYGQIVQKTEDGVGKLTVAAGNMPKVLAVLAKENLKAAECEWDDYVGQTKVTPMTMPKPPAKGPKPIQRK